MILTEEIVLHISKLAYITMTEVEIAAMTRDLVNVVNDLSVLDSLDTTDVPQHTHVLSHVNRWRQDVVQPSPPREMLLASVPAQKNGYIVVQRTVEEGGVTQ